MAAADCGSCCAFNLAAAARKTVAAAAAAAAAEVHEDGEPSDYLPRIKTPMPRHTPQSSSTAKPVWTRQQPRGSVPHMSFSHQSEGAHTRAGTEAGAAAGASGPPAAAAAAATAAATTAADAARMPQCQPRTPERWSNARSGGPAREPGERRMGTTPSAGGAVLLWGKRHTQAARRPPSCGWGWASGAWAMVSLSHGLSEAGHAGCHTVNVSCSQRVTGRIRLVLCQTRLALLKQPSLSREVPAVALWSSTDMHWKCRFSKQ